MRHFTVSLRIALKCIEEYVDFQKIHIFISKAFITDKLIFMCFPSDLCVSISDQTGPHEAVGQWYREMLQRRQSQNRTVLTSHYSG